MSLLHLLAMLALGQDLSPGQLAMQLAHTRAGDEGMVLLSVRAADGNKKLDRQSVVKITNPSAHTVAWKTTDDKSEAEISLSFGQYEIEVSAVGYLSEKKEAQIVNATDTIQMEIDLHRDPSAADLNIADAALPPKARGDVKHAVSALKSANLKEAKKRLDAAYMLAPSNPDLNYLMGYLSYQQKDFAQAQSYLTTAANISSRNGRVLTLLGNVQITQKDYAGAVATLEKAVDADSTYWVAHNLLASAYLGMKNYEGARQQAELAIAEGKTGASAANLVLGQALANLGKREEGIRVLQTFIRNSPSDPSVPQVRNLITRIEGRDADSLPDSRVKQESDASLSGLDPLFLAPELPVSVSPWHPPGIDEAKPSVSEGVSCPFENVIEMSGKRVKELVDNVSRIAAIESMVHEQVNEMGNPLTRETRNYDYEVAISEDGRGGFAVDEDRFERLARADFPDHIATSGFTALALVFHPNNRENFEMTCEGLGSWHGRAAWLVHFKQREDRPPRMIDFKVDDVHYPVHLKGRAWITADKFEIVRIESELASPMAGIRLRYDQQVVEYGAVQFPRKDLELWLPMKAEIYFDLRKRRYYRSQTYDHYMLFSVDSEEKRKEPTMPRTGSPPEKPTPN
ncbi:MAG: tetratricopeptide repeat protein [Terriglobales bacterium]